VRLPLGRRSQPSPPPTVAEALEPIRILLRDADLSGAVRPQSERTTDTLQRGDPIVFLPAGAKPDEWVEIAPSEVMMVVPPPFARRPWMRERRQPQRVTVRIGPYVATGTAHLRIGQERDLMLRATRPFLPLTDATFSRADEAAQHHVETLIVNLNWVEELTSAQD
jgi:hypothetical protein